MKNLFTIALLGGAMALTACGGDKEGDSGDTGAAGTGTATGTATGPGTGTATGGPADAVIVAVQASCPDDTAFLISAETNFTVGDAILNIWEVNTGATGWDEEHALVNAPTAGAEGDDVSWDLTDEGMWVSGSETLFECGIHDTSQSMVYVVRAFDDGGVYEDCVAWGGTRIADVLAMPEGGGDVTMYNGVSDAAQISADNCTEF